MPISNIFKNPKLQSLNYKRKFRRLKITKNMFENVRERVILWILWFNLIHIGKKVLRIVKWFIPNVWLSKKLWHHRIFKFQFGKRTCFLFSFFYKLRDIDRMSALCVFFPFSFIKSVVVFVIVFVVVFVFDVVLNLAYKVKFFSNFHCPNTPRLWFSMKSQCFLFSNLLNQPIRFL